MLSLGASHASPLTCISPRPTEPSVKRKGRGFTGGDGKQRVGSVKEAVGGRRGKDTRGATGGICEGAELREGELGTPANQSRLDGRGTKANVLLVVRVAEAAEVKAGGYERLDETVESARGNAARCTCSLSFLE